MIHGIVAAQGTYGAPHVPWTPTEITTALWLDAADSSTVTLVSSSVSGWADKSGNGINVSQGTASARPTLVSAGQNGLDVFSFDGGDALTSSATTNLIRNIAGAMVFVVRLYAASATVPRRSLTVIGNSSSVSRLVIEAGRTSGRNNVGGRRQDADGYQTATGGSAMSTAWQIQCGVFEYSSAVLTQYINGVSDGVNGTFQTAGMTSDTNSVGLGIGATGSGTGEYFSGRLAEIVIVESVDIATRQKIEGYAAHKWGLTAGLPSGHPYKDSPPFVE